ncbi:MAG: ABC transporter substrate-binding protein [bacterium]
MKKVRKELLFVFIGALAVALVFAAGCAKKNKSAESAASETYKIGAIFSVTGTGSPIGTPEKEAAEMLVENLNKAGGINGHKVELIVEDDASEEAKAVTSANKLLEKDNVIAIIGPSLTGTTLAVVNRLEEKKTPLVSCAAGVKISDPIKPYVFQVAQTDRHSVGQILSYLEKQGVNKIAFINDSNAFGMSGRNEMENAAPQHGFEIVAKETFNGTDTDMTSQLTRIKGTNAQAIVCWGTNPGPAVVTRNMKQLGMKIPLIMSHGVANNKYVELAGASADGVVMPAGRMIVAEQLPDTDPQKPVLMKFAADFKAKYGKNADHFGGHAYDAITLVFDALKNVGPDKEKIRADIENKKGFIGTDGVFNYSAKDHNGLTQDAFVMVKIEKGKWVLLK